MVHLQLIPSASGVYSRESEHEARKSPRKGSVSRSGRQRGRATKSSGRQKAISPAEEGLSKSPATLGQTLNASSVYRSELADDSPRKNGSI
jgi:hypothetical protein